MLGSEGFETLSIDSVCSSNVTVHQLERLTRLAKKIQRVSFRHVHHVGNLIPGNSLNAFNQSSQVHHEWRLILIVFCLN